MSNITLASESEGSAGATMGFIGGLVGGAIAVVIVVSVLSWLCTKYCRPRNSYGRM